MLPVPLHVRSHHSLGFGTASVEALAARAAELGLEALGLTDLESLAGQIRFHDACARVGIRPISGVELRGGHGRHDTGAVAGRLVLLARDATGWASLCRIVSRRGVRPRGAPAPDPVESLAAGTDGLHVLTDDPATLDRLLRTEGLDRARLGLLLVRPGPEERERVAREAADSAGVPLVADPDLAILDAGDRPLHTLLLAVRHGERLDRVVGTGVDVARNAFDASAIAAFADAPEAVRATRTIAASCSLDLRTSRPIPPRPEGRDAAASVADLRSRCRDALAHVRTAGGMEGVAYDERLARELNEIERLGFVDYFLAVADIVRGARELGVATAGRGSAAGSLVAHLLDVTPLDPVRDGLLFERFLHERREAPPDIDLDVASVGRTALTAWTIRRFGRGRVAGVASYATFRARGAVRAGLAALGVSGAQADATLRRVGSIDASGEEEAAAVADALGRSTIPAVRGAADLVARLVGLPSHLAAHPGGIVIGDRPLESLAPLERAPGGTVVTQYDLRSVERAGFLKIDLLGNHFLSERQASLSHLHRTAVAPVGSDDARTWETLDRADTVGLFQVESPAVRSVLRRLPMRGFRDLVAALAIVRPGAAAGAQKERFIRRARGDEAWEPLEILGGDPGGPRYDEVRERLRRTYGVLLYDEDIIRLLAAVGGTSRAAADALRTEIIAAGDDSSELARRGEVFVRAAVASGTGRGVAERAWAAAARFASYSFAEAHAASYAALSWQAAWLRTHAPMAFGAALVDHHRALYPLRTTAAAVERWGVTLLPPSVNRSGLASAPESRPSPGVRIGLTAIKGLTRRTAGDLLEARPFRDLGRLMESVRPSRRELRALLLSGACDDLPPLSGEGYPVVHEAVLAGVEGEAHPDALHRAVASVRDLQRAGPDAERWEAYRRLVRVRNEIGYLDMHVSDHPMRLLRREADRVGCLPSAALPARIGRPVRFAGLLAATRRVETRRGELVFVTLEDEEGLVEGVLFPRPAGRLAERLTTPGPYLVDGTVRETDDDLHLEVTGLEPFHARR